MRLWKGHYIVDDEVLVASIPHTGTMFINHFLTAHNFRAYVLHFFDDTDSVVSGWPKQI